MEENYIGIVLDGAQKIGIFRKIDENNNVLGLILNSQYYITEKRKSKNLLFKYVQKIDDVKYLQIQDYGFGHVIPSNAVWISGDRTYISDGQFIKNKNIQ